MQHPFDWGFPCIFRRWGRWRCPCASRRRQRGSPCGSRRSRASRDTSSPDRPVSTTQIPKHQYTHTPRVPPKHPYTHTPRVPPKHPYTHTPRVPPKHPYTHTPSLPRHIITGPPSKYHPYTHTPNRPHTSDTAQTRKHHPSLDASSLDSPVTTAKKKN